VKIKIFLFLFLICPIFFPFNNAVGQKIAGSKSTQIIQNNGIEIPRLKSNDELIRHSGYTLSFNCKFKLAYWVAYELTREKTFGNNERTNNFVPDPDSKCSTATNQDYQYSGYDRGHLAPAGDMKWSPTAMAESFYYSNICPQNRSFNRGIWKKLESLVRTWAEEYDDVYIVTGPILIANLPTIGFHVVVPKYFYKVILDYTKPDLKGIGFIIPNEKVFEPLQYYAVTIDSVEKVTGIDFFPLLPDDQEKIIEGSINLNNWSWQSSSSSKTSINSPSSKDNRSVSVQCSGITKSGARCKRMTKSPNGKCWQHGGD